MVYLFHVSYVSMFDMPPSLPKMKNKIIKNYPGYLYVKKKLHSHKFLNMSNWIQVLFIGFIACWEIASNSNCDL